MVKNKKMKGMSLQVAKHPNTEIFKKKKKKKKKNKKEALGQAVRVENVSEAFNGTSSILKKNVKKKKKKNINQNTATPIDDASNNNTPTITTEENYTQNVQENEDIHMAEGSPAKKATKGKKRKFKSEEATDNSNVTEDAQSLPNDDIIRKKIKKKKKRKHIENESTPASNPSLTDNTTNGSTTTATIYKQSNLAKAGRTIFVGNVSINTTKKDLKRFFSQYGKVESVRFRGGAVSDPKKSKREAVITRDFHPDRSSMQAYVVFESSDMMEAALKANGVEFLGKHIRVDKSLPSSEKDTKLSVFVGNLSFKAEEEPLREHFASCGEIESVRIVRDSKLLSGKGFGYINFMSADSVELALRLDGVRFMGRQLRVQRSKKKPKGNMQTKKNMAVKFVKTDAENSKLARDDFSGDMVEPKKFNKTKEKKKTEKLGVASSKKGLAFMKLGADNKKRNKAKSDDFSGVKMMETKQFNKIKKKGKLTKEDKKKLYIAHQLTGVKPQVKKQASVIN
nr:RNA-binding protein 34-like [Cherax quadricarinatus]XP_053654252.1 RNA-binding protein 34-like [Cherax quadricarinatus]XP_053654253.1 RNA-binding protein 34-like [Cherax quadricarinatus]XP_053654254.1 RNA-binding protein 34-like [Cherax quadricarinatus]XP_053654255.1 RNA-binding protein 34-like [Cherax quadricarinatus]